MLLRNQRYLAETSYQIFEVKSFCNRERAKPSPIKITALIFLVKNSTVKLSGLNIFDNTRQNFKLTLVFVVVFVLKSKALYCVLPKTSKAKFRLEKVLFLFVKNPKHFGIGLVCSLHAVRSRGSEIKRPGWDTCPEIF